MSRHINIDELYVERNKRRLVKYDIFDTVLKRCHAKIKYIAKKSDMCACLYQVPSILYGLPSYNLLECVYYVIRELVRDGFTVKFAEPDILFITWYTKQEKQKMHNMSSTADTENLLKNDPVFNDINTYKVDTKLFEESKPMFYPQNSQPNMPNIKDDMMIDKLPINMNNVKYKNKMASMSFKDVLSAPPLNMVMEDDLVNGNEPAPGNKNDVSFFRY